MEIKQTVGHVIEGIAGDNTKKHGGGKSTGGKSTLFSDFVRRHFGNLVGDADEFMGE